MSSRGQQRQRDEAREHDEFMALHKGGMQRAQDGPTPADQARLIDKVTESDLETGDAGLENLKAKDFTLANYDGEVDTHEFKFLQEIQNVFSKARYPHPKSGLTGLSRAWAAGDSSARLEPMALDEYARDESYLMGTFSRATRGEGMKQQETAAKQVTESRAIREGTSSGDGGGLIGRFR